MSSTFGQAVRRKLGPVVRRMSDRAMQPAGRMLNLLLRLAMALVFAAVLAGGGLAWRLAQGPLQIDWLTRQVEAAANPDGGPPRLLIGSAALAWKGFTHGVGSPLDIRLTDVALRDAAGARIAEVPLADVSLSAGWLVLGRIVPRALDLQGVRLRAQRDEDGRVSIDLGGNADDAPTPDSAAPAAPSTAPSGGAGVLAGLLAELARPAETDSGGQNSLWTQLRRVRIGNAALTVDDRKLGATWRASQVGIDVVRRDRGGAEANAELTLSLGGERLHMTALATLPAGGTRADVQAQMEAVTPARLAALAPGLTPLRMLDAPVTLSATATVGMDLVPAQVKLQARVGAGRLALGDGSMPLIGAQAEAEGSLTGAALRLQRLEVAPRPDGPRTVLRGSVLGSRADGRLAASIIIELDRVAFADLPVLWPAGVGGPGTRPWMTENITDGTASNGRVELHVTAPDDLSDLQVNSLSGGIEGQDLTVHWLRPVPPLEHVNGKLAFLSADDLEIGVTSGRQAGPAQGRAAQGGLAVQSGWVRISGLAARHQVMSIDADLAGPVPDLLAVLKDPRLHLLDRRPMDLRDPAGGVTGRLSLSRLPLEADLTVDDVHLRASGKITRLHLGGIAAGRDIDQGTLAFSASNDGLKLLGTGLLASIPSQFQVDLDFRNGGPAQVLQKVSVSGTATARELAIAGLDTAGMLEGPAALQATMQSRRDDRGEILVRAELSRAVLQVPRLNFRKPAGQPASAELHMTMDGERISGIDRLRVDGTGIAVAGRVLFADGLPQTVLLERVRLGEATEASGDLRIPGQPGAPWVATLKGRSIDASAEFGRGDAAPPPRAEEADRPGPPWRIDAHFDRVVVGRNNRALSTLAATAESDGQVIRQARLTGQTGAGAPFRLEIVPDHAARTLTGTAEDAGGLLGALDLVDGMVGGRASIHATYDDRAAGHPLQGTTEIVDFRMRDAPGLAKLLQAMTLYGLVETLQGPGLGFNRLIAPFRLSRDSLELTDARAFSASLGMTAKGRIDLARHTVAINGTIVPAYFFNTLLGNIPLIGRLFSPETGGGVFAATYTMSGSMDDPAVSVNPLAALTPGFLRGVFGVLDNLTGSSMSTPQSPGPPN